MPTGSQQDVEILGQTVSVTFVPLRHGMRVDCHFMIGARQTFFRCRDKNAAAALALLRAEIRRARDAAAIKLLRKWRGLRLVE